MKVSWSHCRWIARIVPIGLMLLLAPIAWAVGLESVLQNIKVAPPSRVDFVEERHNNLLREPLVLTGYLEYLGEGRLRKVVQTPFAESFLMEDRSLQVSRDGNTRKVSLQNYRAMQVMLSGVEAILAGDSSELENVFDCTVTGSARKWNMKLVPRSRRIARKLDGIVVTGNAESITSMRFNLGDGEWHLMRIGGRDSNVE